MNVVIKHSSGKAGDGIISFPHLQCWNPVTEVATIAADVSGKRVSCRIRIDDLRKKFDIVSEKPMQSVTEYRVEIEAAARGLIENKDFKEDGSIMINYDDL